MSNCLRENQDINAIIHTATSYGREGEDVSHIIKSNVIFPVRLMELGCQYSIPYFFNTDTFFNTKDLSYNYLTAYTLSKKHFVEWGMEVAHRKILRFINVKVFHLYGPGDSSTKFTMRVVRSLLQNVAELKLTEGTQKRDFIHIKDVVSAYLLLLEKAKAITSYFQSFEVGSGEAISIRKYVETAHRVSGSSTKLNFGALAMRDGELIEFRAENGPLKALGWSPQVDLENGIKT